MMNVDAVCLNLGVKAREFVAGQTLPGGFWDRVATIESADVVFAWYDSRSDAWWSDVAYAASKGKYIVTAESAFDVVSAPYSGALLARLHGHLLHYTPDPQHGVLAARALAFHDPKALAEGWQDSRILLEPLLLSESPIEARLACHLAGAIAERTVCRLQAQRELLEGRYRADFVITNEWLEEGPNPQAIESTQKMMDYRGPIRIVVETDGHDFHEKSKEQASRDRRRDRELQTAGWKVLRFTGSEVWADPRACVAQIHEFVDALGGAIY
jgi:hypothetical protein